MAEANAKAAEKAAKEREASIQKLEEQALCDIHITHTCVGAVLCTHVCMYLVTDCRWPWPGGRVEEACDGHAQGEEEGQVRRPCLGVRRGCGWRRIPAGGLARLCVCVVVTSRCELKEPIYET